MKARQSERIGWVDEVLLFQTAEEKKVDGADTQLSTVCWGVGNESHAEYNNMKGLGGG
jgi:hypothetical protein